MLLRGKAGWSDVLNCKFYINRTASQLFIGLIRISIIRPQRVPFPATKANTVLGRFTEPLAKTHMPGYNSRVSTFVQTSEPSKHVWPNVAKSETVWQCNMTFYRIARGCYRVSKTLRYMSRLCWDMTVIRRDFEAEWQRNRETDAVVTEQRAY